MRALRWTSGLATACALLCACKAVVRSGLSEPAANQIVVALDRAAIVATKNAGGAEGPNRFQIEVASTDMTRALKVLEAQRLPSTDAPGFEDLYRDTGLVATPHEERARWAAATAGELSRSIERFPGVRGARVHLAVPVDAAPLDAERAGVKAVVLIQRNRAAPPIDENKVRALVAAAVDRLGADHVTVVQIVADPAPSSARSWTRVGPITVTSDSALALKTLLGSALVLDLAMAIVLVVLARTRRRPSDR